MEIDFRISAHGTCSDTSGSTCVKNRVLEQLVGRYNYDNNVSMVNITNERSQLSSFTAPSTVPLLDLVC
jgi:hypothetical protein